MDEVLEKYSKSTVWIHWVSTVLIFICIGTGITMEGAEKNMDKLNLYRVHFLSGIVTFLVTIPRTILLLREKKPTPLYPEKSSHQVLIKVVHYGFYLIIIGLCVSGAISLSIEGILVALKSGNPDDLPDMVEASLSVMMLSHHALAKIMFVLLAMHVGGVALHYIRYKQNALKRIWM